jgi:predicted PhzF superfamily epimerase YddE/YHI9
VEPDEREEIAREDPVTGSLNAGLAMWLTRTGRATTPYTAAQGTVLGREGRIRVTADASGTLWVGGGTVTCIEGVVTLERGLGCTIISHARSEGLPA